MSCGDISLHRPSPRKKPSHQSSTISISAPGSLAFKKPGLVVSYLKLHHYLVVLQQYRLAELGELGFTFPFGCELIAAPDGRHPDGGLDGFGRAGQRGEKTVQLGAAQKWIHRYRKVASSDR